MADSLDWGTVSAAIQNWVVTGSGLAADHVFWAYEGKPRPSAPYIELSIQQVRSIGHDWTTSEANVYSFAPIPVAVVHPTTDTLVIPNHPFANGDGPIRIASTIDLPAPLTADTDCWIIYVDPNTIQLAESFTDTGGPLPVGAGNPVMPLNLTTAGDGVITVVSTTDTTRAGQEVIRRAQGFREMTIHMECFAVEGGGFDAMRILTNVLSSLQLHLYELDQAGVGVSDLAQALSQGGIQHLEGRRGGILEPRSMVDLTVYLASILTGFDTIIESVNATLDVTREDGTTQLPEKPLRIPFGSWSPGFDFGFGGD